MPTKPPLRCEICGKEMRDIADTGALVVSFRRKKEFAWCIDCWDNNPNAVEQYREVSLFRPPIA